MIIQDNTGVVEVIQIKTNSHKKRLKKIKIKKRFGLKKLRKNENARNSISLSRSILMSQSLTLSPFRYSTVLNYICPMKFSVYSSTNESISIAAASHRSSAMASATLIE